MIATMTKDPVRKVPLTVVPITPQRAFEDIAMQIRGLILDGKLKPGDRLPPERDLSVLFNVSRSTLREGLRALELSGILESRKGRPEVPSFAPEAPRSLPRGWRTCTTSVPSVRGI